MNQLQQKALLLLATVLFFLSSCRRDDDNWTSPPQPTVADTTSSGLYLLNEGGWGYNNSTLDFFDVHNGIYTRDFFTKTNPDAVLGLGDTGNDLQVYGNKLYVVMNWSKKIEVLNAQTGKRIKTITTIDSKAIENARYITFANGFAYLSSYTTSENGTVLEIDTTTLNVTRSVQVGRQPDELVAVGNKLYVANSGGYSPNNPERIVSVIDLTTLEVTKTIDVAPNLRRIKKDGNGNLFVCPWGTSNKLYVIDSKTDRLIDSIAVRVENFTISKDTAYVYGAESTGGNYNYSRIDLKTKKVLPGQFITDGTKIQTPYGIAIEPKNGSIYIADARNYVEAGDLYCFDATGKKKFVIEKTGIIPVQIAFAPGTKSK